MEINLYDYLNYRIFLNDYYNWQKKINAKFSHRYFCQRAGFKTSNVLKLIISNQRNLSRSGALKFLTALKLDKKQQRYFQTLVLYNQAQSEEQKSQYLEELFYLKQKVDVRNVEIKHYEFYKEWYHTVIREIIELPDFNGDPEWITKKAYPVLSNKKVKASLKLLKEIGFVEQDARGKLKVTNSAITTPTQLNSEVVANFNREMIKLAMNASLNLPKEKREISGVTLRISKKCFADFKMRVAELKQDLLKRAVLDKNSDGIYQFNFQIFPLVVD